MGTYPATCTEKERNEIRAILSYITGDQVPVITMFSPTAYMYLNTERLGGWPAADDLLWLGMGSYADRGLSYLFRWNILKPNLGLTISVSPTGGGTTSIAPGTIKYVKGTTVTVTATPASGYTFKNWKLDGAERSGATISVTMDTSHTLEAVFEALPPYELYAGGIIVVVVVIAAVYFVLRRRKPVTG